jgi:hypothetical protein
MSNSSVLLRPFEGYHARGHLAAIAGSNRNLAPVIDRLSDHGKTRNPLLDCYLEGWAEANLVKILAATSAGYRFHDPFVGNFSQWSLHEYFDLVPPLRSRRPSRLGFRSAGTYGRTFERTAVLARGAADRAHRRGLD